MIFNYQNKNKEPALAGLEFTFSNQRDGVAVIDIDGKIGRDIIQEWLTGEKSENTGKQIKEKIRGISASKIIVNINSTGGDVNDGIYIHDLLAEHPATVETVMRGLNASAATIIGQAGDTRKLSDNGLYLVHLPMLGICSMINRYDVDLLRDDLERVESRIANIYQKRANKEKDFVELMEQAQGRGVWLQPQEALDYGLVDEVYEPTDTTEDTLSQDAKNMLNMLGIPLPQNGNGKHPEKPVQQQQELKELEVDGQTIKVLAEHYDAALGLVERGSDPDPKNEEPNEESVAAAKARRREAESLMIKQ